MCLHSRKVSINIVSEDVSILIVNAKNKPSLGPRCMTWVKYLYNSWNVSLNSGARYLLA